MGRQHQQRPVAPPAQQLRAKQRPGCQVEGSGQCFGERSLDHLVPILDIPEFEDARVLCLNTAAVTVERGRAQRFVTRRQLVQRPAQRRLVDRSLEVERDHLV